MCDGYFLFWMRICRSFDILSFCNYTATALKHRGSFCFGSVYMYMGMHLQLTNATKTIKLVGIIANGENARFQSFLS